MPLEPILDPKQALNQKPDDSVSTVDVTGAYHPESRTTLPHVTAGVVPLDTPAIPGYVIIGELARGGMGRVLSGREMALDREVAIKTMLPKADASRFITEAKITARLPHPGIPPVHALGTLSDGSPFLAMKLVRGKTLAEALKARPHPLHDLPRFLQVFEQIAQAVGFAHSQGIIHRDLKPANVMVGAFGEVQVMDWGLAKDLSGNPQRPPGLQQDNTRAEPSGETAAWETETPPQHGDQTRSGAVMGTPNYMAPEQARGEVVDTRADVFALGGMLCTILTGQAVFGGTTVLETLNQAAAGDTAEALARLEISKADGEVIDLAKRCLSVVPSERPADGQAVAGLVAAYRQGVEARLKQAETAQAEALVREAEGRKRRNVWLGLAATMLAGMVASGILAWWANNSRMEADKKRQEALTNLAFAKKGNEILGSVFMGLDPNEKYETVVDLRNALKANLQQAVQQLEGSSIGDPLEVALMQSTLGMSLRGLGEATSAILLLQQSTETYKARLGPTHPDTLNIMDQLASCFQDAGQIIQAVTLYRETVRLKTDTLGLDHLDTITSMGNLGGAYRKAGEYGPALSMLEESYRLQKDKLGADHRQTLVTQNSLAETYREAGQLDKAILLYEDVFQRMKKQLGNNHPDLITCMNNLAIGYYEAGRHDKALPLLEESVKMDTARYGRDHHKTLTTAGNLASVYQATSQFDKALPIYEETLRVREVKLGADHPDTLNSKVNLAAFYHRTEQLDKSVPLYEVSLRAMKEKLGVDHPSTLHCMDNLALNYEQSGQITKALPLFEEALQRMKDKLGVNHPQTLSTMSRLASCHETAGNWKQAEPLLEESFKRTKATLGPDHLDTISAMSNLAQVYLNAGKPNQAIPLMEQTLELRKSRLGSDHADTLASMGHLAKGYQIIQQYDKSLALFEESLRHCKIKLGAEHPSTLIAMNNLATDYQEAGRDKLAVPLYEEILAIQLKKLAIDDPNTLLTKNNLGSAYRNCRQLSKALPLLVETHVKMKDILGNDHPNTLNCKHNLAQCYRDSGQMDKSLKLLEETVTLKKAKLSDNHPDTLKSLDGLAFGYSDAGQLSKAVPLFEESYRLKKESLGSEHPKTLNIMNHLGICLWKMKQLDKSIPLFEESLRIQERTLGRQHPETQMNVSNLGVNYRDAGRLAEAIPLLEEAYRAAKKTASMSFVGTSLLDAYVKADQREAAVALVQELLVDVRQRYASDLGMLDRKLISFSKSLLQVKAYPIAESLLRETLTIRQKAQPDAWTTFDVQANVGGVLLTQKKYAEAEPILLKGYEGIKTREKTLTTDAERLSFQKSLANALDRLIQLYTETNKPDEVKKWQAEKEKLTKATEKK